MPTEMLIDGNSLAYRAFYALPTDMATSSGQVTNAVYGFTSMLINLMRDRSPDNIAVAFDRPEPTFRHRLTPSYKAQRESAPEILREQIGLLRQVLEALGIPVLDSPGVEADDIIATLATRARDNDDDALIVTGDRDSFQLVEDPHVKVLYCKRGVSDYALYDEAGIEERTGVRPEDYLNYAALRGDASDNLPGVPGVGEKTAAKLVNEHLDIDGIYAGLDQLTPRLRQNLTEAEASVRNNVEMMRLVRDVPFDDEAALRQREPDIAEVRRLFDFLELRSLWDRIAPLLGQEPPQQASVLVAETIACETVAEAVAAIEAAAAGTGVLAMEALSSGVQDGLVFAAAGPEAGDLGAGAPVAGASGVAAADMPGPGTADTGVPEAGDAEPGTDRGAAAHGLRPLDRPSVGAAAAGSDSGASPPVDVVFVPGRLLGDPAVGSALSGLLGPQGRPVAMHGAKDTVGRLLSLGIDMRDLATDTELAAYLLDPADRRYDLGELLRRHCSLELPATAESEGRLDFDGEDPDDLAEAPACRALAVDRLVAPLREALQSQGLLHLHDDMEVPLVRVLAKMENRGIAVDPEVLRRIRDELTAETETLRSRVIEHAGRSFNVNSTKQLAEVLFDDLGLTPQKRTKRGYATDARTLEKMKGEHPIIEDLLSYREVEKLRSTYGEGLLAEVGEGNRIRATFNQTVARTGRLSSDRPNLHNIPVRSERGRVFRTAFTAPEGCRLLIADYDQIELRCIAHLAEDPGLIEAFEAGDDIHTATAAKVFGIDPAAVGVAERSQAKMVSYGLAYGMESYGLSQRLGIGVPEAETILESYFGAFPAVRRYMHDAVAEARQRGYTETLFGRRRQIPELSSSSRQVRHAGERQAMNAGIQGLAADIFKVALVRLDRVLEERGLEAGIVLQVHDEIIVEAPTAEVDTAAELIRSTMAEAFELRVPLEVDLQVTATWAEAKG